MEISDEFRTQLAEDRRCVVNEIEQIENQIYGEAFSGAALAKMSPRKVQRYRMGFVPQAKTSEWQNSGFTFLRAIGQSVSINPDGHVKLQKATEKPLDIDSLDSTALEFQSDEETSLAKEKLPAMDSLDSTALEFPNGEETSLAKETPPAPPAPPPAIGSLDSAALEFQTVEENSLAEEAPPPAKDSLDSAALEFQNAEENSLARTKLMEAVDAEEKKLWSATVEEMGPIIKIMLQQLQESMAIQNE